MRIALLGATGYLGRSLLAEAGQRGLNVVPFGRDEASAKEAFKRWGIALTHPPRGLETFMKEAFDVVINATGIGSPKQLSENPRRVFRVTEDVDDMIFSYLERYRTVRIFNISSGAVYGRSVGRAVDDDTPATFPLSAIRGGDYYALAKLYSEIKHRAYPEYHVVDLRVFAFVSRFLDPDDAFLMSELAKCLRDRKVFVTSSDDMVRDYATAAGLLELILFFCAKEPLNLACDVQTRAPVTKFQLLEHFARAFGLRYEMTSSATAASPTGQKSIYCSRATTLAWLGFSPRETSLEGIDREMRAYMQQFANPSA